MLLPLIEGALPVEELARLAVAFDRADATGGWRIEFAETQA